MVKGTGFDLVAVDRLRAFRARWGERGLRRIFSPGELTYCLGHADPAQSLAARFAAKEAFFKALGLGWGPGGDWVEVEVRRDARGAPSLEVHGRAAAALERLGGRRVHVSLTHTADTAGAFVVVEDGA